MRRRKFITLLGGGAAWPLTARAQRPALPVIGFVRITTPEDSIPYVLAFKQGLAESDFVEGRNLTIEYRYALNQVARLPELMTELVGRRVAVIVATGGTIAARAAKTVTSTVPIVFTTGNDPVRGGLVASLNRPGGNEVPANISLLHLPPASPELNPTENVWQHLRQTYLSNRVFRDYDDVVEASSSAWNKLTAEPGRIASIGTRSWTAVSQGP
jgi:hypothetical protein